MKISFIITCLSLVLLSDQVAQAVKIDPVIGRQHLNDESDASLYTAGSRSDVIYRDVVSWINTEQLNIDSI